LATKKAAFIHSAELENFSYPEHCPFDTDRAGRVRKVLKSMGLLSGQGRSEVAPVAARREVLRKFHSTGYLHALRDAARGRWKVEMLGMGIGTVDCPVFAGMHDYPVLATGGTLTAAELILSGSAAVAFNPSGGFRNFCPPWRCRRTPAAYSACAGERAASCSKSRRTSAATAPFTIKSSTFPPTGGACIWRPTAGTRV